jgi:guanyl-specific ribonuclease Sa
VDPSGFSDEPIEPIRLIGPPTFVPPGVNVDLQVSRPKEKSLATAAEVGAEAPPTDVDTTGSSSVDVPQGSTTAPEEDLERSGFVRGTLGFSYGVGQAWAPGGFLAPSPAPKDGTFEFWRGAGQFTAGVVELVAGVGLIGGGGAAAGGGIAGAIPTGGASLIATVVGASAVTAGWAAVAQGATGILAGAATIADSLSLSTGTGSSGSQATPSVQGATTRVVSGATVTPNGKPAMTGNVNVGPTLDRIRSGGSFPHRNDGAIFRNDQGLLPKQPAGYYREYVHPTPGVSGPGPQRVVVGKGGELYYTPDHYQTFIPLK